MKKKIKIIGSVHDVGYRPFLLGIAESLEIEHFFADNTYINGRQAVFALVDSSEEKVNAFLEIASSKFPEKSQVEKVESEDYSGNVMKAENYYRYLTAMQLSKIATYGGKMLGKQDDTIEAIKSVKEDTQAMLGKQDDTIEAIKSVKEDTQAMLGKQDDTIEAIKSVKEDTQAMLREQDETVSVIKEEGERNREAFRGHFANDIARIYEEINEMY